MQRTLAKLVSSFLDEKFVEGQIASKAVAVDICKAYCENWARIGHSVKANILHHQFANQFMEKAMDQRCINA